MLKRGWGALCATTMLLLGAGCGGGGGGESEVATNGSTGNQVQAPAEPITYNGSTLPGRLMVTRMGDINVWNLATGQGTHVGDEDDEVEWAGGASPDTVLRYDYNGPLSRPVAVSFMNTTTWTKSRPDLVLNSWLTEPKLSPDGRYILSFWHDARTSGLSDPLTIHDTATGQVVKQGSTIHDDEFDTLVASPAAWLPDGSYTYLKGNLLYRSSPADRTEWGVATLDLPDNLAMGGKGSMWVDLVASPDGKKLAFTWNGNIWAMAVDGSDLHRMTAVAADSVLGPSFGSPTWSPDSKWVAGALFRSGNVTGPVFSNPDATINPGYQIIGSTGCNSPVFVLPYEARSTVISWPRWDNEHGVKVRSRDGKSLLGLTVCGSSLYWLP